MIHWTYGIPIYLLISVAFGVWLTTHAYKYRDIPGKRYLWVLIGLATFMVFTTVFELMSTSLQMKIWFRNFSQIPLFMISVFSVAFARDYVSKCQQQTKRLLIVFSAHALVYFILIFTDSFHHFMRSEIALRWYGQISETVVQPTILNTLFIVSNQILNLIAAVMLIAHTRNVPKHYMKQHFYLLTGFLIPIVTNVLLQIILVPTPGLLALSFLVSGIVLYIGVIRYQLFSIWPIAKNKIFMNLRDGIIVTDSYHRIIDVNPAATAFLLQLQAGEQKEWVGSDCRYLLQEHEQLLEAFDNKKECKIELTIELDEVLHYQVSFIPILEQKDYYSGMVIIFSDVTELKNIQLELLRQATMDELTALYNRRQFVKLVKEQIDEVSFGFSLILMDIDDFKYINDRYGHIVGDEVLVRFAKLLKQVFTDGCLVGRIGGEEFAVFMKQTTLDDSHELAEKARKRIESHEIRLHNGDRISITSSFGIAYAEYAGHSFESMYGRADAALYQSKLNGKNVVCVTGA